MALFDSNNIGAWKLTSGATTTDSGGAGLGLTLTDHGTVGNANGHGGGTNTAASFTAATMWLSRADQSELDLSSFTIAAWIYKTSTPSSYGSIVGKFLPTGNQRSFLFNVNSSGKLEIRKSYNGTAEEVLAGTTTIPNSTWKHVIVTYDSSSKQMTLYINNVQEAQSTLTNAATYNSTADLCIGSSGDNSSSYNFRGRIDDVYISNTVISAQDRADLYALGDDFPVAAQMAAAAASVSSGAADLTTQIQMAASGASVSSGAANLTVPGTFAASGASVSSGAADLTTQIQMAASGASVSSGSAALAELVRFWVNGNGVWDMTSTANWSYTDGGPSGALAPAAIESARFTANSGAGNFTVLFGEQPALGQPGSLCKDWIVDPGTSGKIITFDSAAARPVPTVCGNTWLHPSTVITRCGELSFLPLSPSTITTNGVVFGTAQPIMGVNFPAIGPATSTTLLDSWTVAGTIVIQGGTFYQNGQNITCSNVLFNNYSNREVVLNGVWTLNAGGWDILNPGGTVTITPPTPRSNSRIRLTASIGGGSNISFGSGGGRPGQSYGIVEVATAGAGTVDFKASNTIDTLQLTGLDRNIRLEGAKTHHFRDLQCNGSAGHLNSITSTNTSQYTLAKDGGGIVNADYLNVSYGYGSAPNVWYVGRNSTDGGNNTNLIFSESPEMFASGASVSSGSADLGTQIQMAASGASVSYGSADLGTQIQMEASGASVSSGSADLITGLPVQEASVMAPRHLGGQAPSSRPANLGAIRGRPKNSSMGRRACH